MDPRPKPLLLLMGALAVLLGGLPAWSTPSQGEADALTRLLTAEASKNPKLHVVGQAEVRDALELESKREALGCATTDKGVCIAEIAAAMGTSHVVQAQLGTIGQSTLLTLQLFDDQATAVGRKALSGATVDDIARQLAPAVADLLTAGALWPAPPKGASLLVLDVRVLQSTEVPETAEAAPPTLLMAGALVTAAGAAALVGAGGLGVWLAVANETPASMSQSNLVLLRDGTLGLLAVGAGVTLVGAAATGGAWLLDGGADGE